MTDEPPHDERWEGFTELSRDEQRVFVEREWFGRICTEAMRPAIEAAFDELRPDLVLREPCEYASAIVAHERGVPFVTVAISNAEGEWGATTVAAPALPDAVVDVLRECPLLTRFPAHSTLRRIRTRTGTPRRPRPRAPASSSTRPSARSRRRSATAPIARCSTPSTASTSRSC